MGKQNQFLLKQQNSQMLQLNFDHTKPVLSSFFSIPHHITKLRALCLLVEVRLFYTLCLLVFIQFL